MAQGDLEKLLALAQNDPARFQTLINQVEGKVVHPHSGQAQVLDSTARFKVMNCGRRWGKTVLAAKMAVQATRKPKQMIWWVAPTYRITKRGYAEVLRQLPDGVLSKPAPPDTTFDAGRPAILHFKNGTVMEFYSAERPEGMLGAAVDFVVLDEAARMPAHVWFQTVSPTLIDHKGRAVIISTPRGHNWFYQVWTKGQDAQQTDWESWTQTTQDNPTLPPGEADRMAADLPRTEADQEIYAKFLAAGSSTFFYDDRAIQNDIIREDNYVDGCPPKGFVVLGIDLARSNDYTVIYGANARTRRNCYFERMSAITWPEQKRRIRRAVARLSREPGVEGVMLVMDTTGVGDPVVEDLEAEGYDVVPINFTTHKVNMVRLLAKDLEEAKAFILADGFTDEFRNYSMAITPGGKMTYSAPEGSHDDVVAAKMLQHWGIINEGVAEVAVLSAEPGPVLGEHQSEGTDDDEYDAWDDLLEEDELSDDEALEAVGLATSLTPPTTDELLRRPDLWV